MFRAIWRRNVQLIYNALVPFLLGTKLPTVTQVSFTKVWLPSGRGSFVSISSMAQGLLHRRPRPLRLVARFRCDAESRENVGRSLLITGCLRAG